MIENDNLDEMLNAIKNNEFDFEKVNNDNVPFKDRDELSEDENTRKQMTLRHGELLLQKKTFMTDHKDMMKDLKDDCKKENISHRAIATKFTREIQELKASQEEEAESELNDIMFQDEDVKIILHDLVLD